MKRTILFVSLICFFCVASFTVEAQQRRQQQKARQPQRGVSLDGNWTGRTGQNRTFTFTVLNGRITEFSAEGRFQGYACSTTSTVTTAPNKPILNKSFSFNSPGGPGGMSLNVKGNFTSSTTAQGTASMELHAIPGPPPGVPGHVPGCGGFLRTTWVALKGDQPPTEEALKAAKTPARKAGSPLIELISPKEEEALDNGCRNLKEPIIWEFRWSEARGAQRYHLYVIHEFAGNPVIDNSDIKSTSFTHQSKGLIPSQNLTGWTWKVRPMIKGVWKDWSDERTFGVEPENSDCAEWTTLVFREIEKGDAARVKELLSQEWADVNALDREGRSPLGVAAGAGHVEIVKLLLAAGAKANTALMAAAKEGRTEVVLALLDEGASVKDSEFAEKTTLFLAAENGHAETVKLLLRRGADPNKGGFGFKVPLVAATRNGHAEVVRALLEAGADADAREFGGGTVLSIAKRNGFTEIVQLLRKHGARE